MIAKSAALKRICAAALFIFYLALLWNYYGDPLNQCIITIVVLVICCVYLYYSLQKEIIRAGSEKLRADEFEEAIAGRFGHRVGKLEIEASITNYNGDCDTKWVWADIRSIYSGSPITSIPGRIHFSTQNASISEFPTLLPEYTNNYEIEFLSKGTKLCLFQVRVKEGANEIGSGYGYTASIERAFCMSEAELAEETLNYEWFGFAMTSIIENLSIKIAFPRPYKPDSVQFDVCIGLVPTDISDYDEIERVAKEGSFRNESGEISITVKKPKLGYLYFLRWRPLPKIIVDGMRQRELH